LLIDFQENRLTVGLDDEIETTEDQSESLQKLPTKGLDLSGRVHRFNSDLIVGQTPVESSLARVLGENASTKRAVSDHCDT